MSCAPTPGRPRHLRSSSTARRRFRPPFVRTRLMSRSSSGPGESEPTGSNNGEVNCAGSARRSTTNKPIGRCRLFSRRKDGRFTRRRSARCAPRNGDSRSSARLRILLCSRPPQPLDLASPPMIDGLAPDGLDACLRQAASAACPRSRCCCWRVPRPWRSPAAAGSKTLSRPFNQNDAQATQFSR